MYICCGIFSNDFYATESFISGLTYGEAFGILIAIYQFIVVLTTFREIYKYQYANHQPDDPIGETMVMSGVFKQIFAWILFVVSMISLVIICKFPSMTDRKNPEVSR